MTDTPNHEHIEQAFKPATDLMERLPDCIETREARRVIGVAENLAHEARERHAPKEETS